MGTTEDASPKETDMFCTLVRTSAALLASAILVAAAWSVGDGAKWNSASPDVATSHAADVDGAKWNAGSLDGAKWN